MKKNKDTSNLIFSAFLVTAFVICAHFFSGLITTSTGMNDTVKGLLTALIFVIFGLFLFYATRVGDGKQVRRFSLATLIILDIPALYIIIASVAPGLPFSQQISSSTVMIYLASVALGYGIPYTFVSGYEQQLPNEEDNLNKSDDIEDNADKDSNIEENDCNNNIDEDKEN